KIDEQILVSKEHVSQYRSRCLYTLWSRSLFEFPHPANQIFIKTRFNVKWAFCLKHPSQALADNAGRRKGNNMPGCNQTGIPVGTIIFAVSFFTDRHIGSFFA